MFATEIDKITNGDEVLKIWDITSKNTDNEARKVFDTYKAQYEPQVKQLYDKFLAERKRLAAEIKNNTGGGYMDFDVQLVLLKEVSNSEITIEKGVKYEFEAENGETY